jgi:hypothetical protein
MPLITPDDYLKRRDIIYYEDWNKKLEKTMLTTLEKINNFLKEIHINDVQVTSGWRPQQLNDSIKNAAVKSKHITCEAVDLLDMKPFLLMHAILENLIAAEIHGVYFEDFRYTPTWVHIQVTPPKSGQRIFIPSSNEPLAPQKFKGFEFYDRQFI